MRQASRHSNYLALNRRSAVEASGFGSSQHMTGDTIMTTPFTPAPLLRNALGLDAVASAASGLLMAAGASPLSSLLGLSVVLLTGAGFACLAWAAFVAWASRRGELTGGLVWTIIALNALWVVESVLILVLGWVQPTTLGIAFVIAQAAVVVALTEAQYIGLQRSKAAALPA
jgi:hypothetical protein